MASIERIYDAIVVGAGVEGSATAYSLAKQGKDVLLLEQVRVCGRDRALQIDAYSLPILLTIMKCIFRSEALYCALVKGCDLLQLFQKKNKLVFG